VHLYPSEANANPAAWAESRGETHWSTLCTRRRRDGTPVQGFPSLDGLLRSLDAAGIERAVLQGWYWENPDTCALQNRFYAECVRSHPGRLSAFATFHPAAGPQSAIAELKRAREEGLTGLGELSPHSQDFPLDDPAWCDALHLAAEFDWPVTLHVTDPEGKPYPGRVETPLADFLKIANSFPTTTFVLAHWGGLLPLRLPEAAAYPNLYYDTAASPLLYAPSIWCRFVKAVGDNRVIFGSDYPLNTYPSIDSTPGIARLLSEARASGLGETHLDHLLRTNASRLLRLRPLQ
jgi:predicted TIM-barrel fold metal-dependent hydrolase